MKHRKTPPAGAQALRQRRQQRTARARLTALACAYAGGAISWREIREETGIAFGDLLVELARMGLQLPRVSAAKSAAQRALFEEILRAAASKKGDAGSNEEIP